jgi:hypothetical protein
MEQHTLTLDDFQHYYFNVKQISQFLRSNECVPAFDTLLLMGHSGCGKSSMLNLIFNEYEYDILTINQHTYTSISQLRSKVKAFCTLSSVLCFFESKPKMIFIEDADVLLNIDRGISGLLQDMIKNKFDDFIIKCPIICVMNTLYMKRINEMKTYFKHLVVLNKLSYKQCFQIIYNKVLQYDDKDKFDVTKVIKLIKQNNNNLSVILNNLYDTGKHLKEVDDIHLVKKDPLLDMTPYELVKLLISRTLTQQEIHLLMTHDINQITSYVHEVYYQPYTQKKSVDISELDLTCKTNAIILDFERLNTLSFDVVDSSLWENITYNKLYHLNRTTTNGLYTKLDEQFKFQFRFSQVINKQSLALNFNKKLIGMQRNLGLASRGSLGFPLLYLYSVCMHGDTNTITKNELEIINRFVSDYEPTHKQKFSKLKSPPTK